MSYSDKTIPAPNTETLTLRWQLYVFLLSYQRYTFCHPLYLRVYYYSE